MPIWVKNARPRGEASAPSRISEAATKPNMTNASRHAPMPSATMYGSGRGALATAAATSTAATTMSIGFTSESRR